jgi:uncharacterized protein YegL
MTDPTKTHIALVLDRSGSMQTQRDSYQNVLDEFVNEQKQAEGSCDFTLVQFDTEVETIYHDTPIDQVGPIRLAPRGRTALLDAMGSTITLLGETLRAKEEGDRPGKVLVAILTDGYENASRDWTLHRVQAAVSEQENKWGWEFLYISADLSAPQQAQAMGIRDDHVNVYAATYAGTQSMGQHVNSSVKRWRRGPGGQSISIDPGEREGA